MRGRGACQRSRSGADVTNRGESRATERGDATASRFRSYVLFLASLSGAGLYFVGGVHDPTSWFVFAVVVSVGVAATTRWLTEREEPADARAGSTLLGPSASQAEEAESPPGVGAASHSTPPSADDEVDYLRALRHEFRTPLNAVLGFSDVLLSGIDGEVNASQQEDLEIIRASGIRLRVLLDSALDITQLAEGELRLDVDRVDLAELVSRAGVEACQLWSNKRAPECLVPEGSRLLEADESRIRRSILVLADFLATMHRDAAIHIRATSTGEQVAIEVSAEPSENRILDAVPTTADVLASEDIGKIRQWPVAVTAELVTRHGGSLYHGSEPSRFLIRLPLGGSA